MAHKVLEFAHNVVAQSVFSQGYVAGGRPGCVAVDATAGNGRDTLRLARLVGPMGTVHAFDVQEPALARTRERLSRAGQDSRVVLHHRDHGGLAEVVPAGVAAAMFNLGYLPGGDHAVTTNPESTVRALQGAARLLDFGGVITVVIYRGHSGGPEEADAVLRWAGGLPAAAFSVVCFGFSQAAGAPPQVVAVWKS